MILLIEKRGAFGGAVVIIQTDFCLLSLSSPLFKRLRFIAIQYNQTKEDHLSSGCESPQFILSTQHSV